MSLRSLTALRAQFSSCCALACVSFLASTATAIADLGNPAEHCDRAAQQAAEKSRVPLEILRAITRTETGRGGHNSLKPWPWTVNMEGTGVWFDTESQAQSYVFRHFKRGARSFDIGCFQINYRWHAKAFNSIEEMFDPTLNADYAASFLAKLHQELGDWDKAVGAYHSRTHKYAQRYLKRFAEIRENMPDSVSKQSAPQPARGKVMPNRGSLVPLGNSPARSLFAKTGG